MEKRRLEPDLIYEFDDKLFLAKPAFRRCGRKVILEDHSQLVQPALPNGRFRAGDGTFPVEAKNVALK